MKNIFIIDRSNLDEVVCIIPRGHQDNATDAAIQVTRREDLQRGRGFRTDIVFARGRTGRQFFLYACPNGGVTGDLFLLEVLSEEQYVQVMDIARKMARNAEEFEPAASLLTNTHGYTE